MGLYGCKGDALFSGGSYLYNFCVITFIIVRFQSGGMQNVKRNLSSSTCYARLIVRVSWRTRKTGNAWYPWGNGRWRANGGGEYSPGWA